MASPLLRSRVDAALALLQRVAGEYRPAAFASSLGAEDMVLTDLIARHRLGLEIFTLDTGRLHGDTLALPDAIQRRYDLTVAVFRPDAGSVERYVREQGRDAFYRGIELRKQCCEIRKVEPLRRALAGRKAWVTGLRRDQAATRAEVQLEEWDAAHGLHKFNPLADWSEEAVWDYLRLNGVPYNALHDQGYRSIGCAPCTRPVVAGEDARAGRWWWERRAASECGLHFSPDGRLVRERSA